MGEGRHSPLQTRADATRIMFTFLCQNSLLSCLQREGQSRVSRGTATRPRRVWALGNRAHLPVYQLRGAGATQQLQGDHHWFLQRGCSAAPSMQPWERRQKREAGPQHRSGDQGQRYKGVRKGPADPNPQNHHPAQHRVKGQEAPPLATQSGPWEASPQLALSPVLSGKEAPKARGCMLEQAVTTVINANSLSAP